MTLITTKDLVFNNMIEYPDMTIEKGKMTFIQGASGSGKSTLFCLFNATINPSQGTIYYNKVDISTINALELRRKILLINQQVYLFDGTIADNFRQFHAYRSSTPPTETAMKEFLHIAAAPFTPEQDVARLSGGEKQRVFNAIMLSFNAEVYMWDEPSAALDSPTATTFFTRMKEYMAKHDKTTLVISHDDTLYPKFSDALIELKSRHEV